MKRWFAIMIVPALVAGFFSVSAPGCGGVSCEDAVDQLCAKACECGGDKCRFGDETFSISFDDQGKCVTLYSLGCGSEAFDPQACVDALGTAECSGDALLPPAACDSGDSQ